MCLLASPTRSRSEAGGIGKCPVLYCPSLEEEINGNLSIKRSQAFHRAIFKLSNICCQFFILKDYLLMWCVSDDDLFMINHDLYEILKKVISKFKYELHLIWALILYILAEDIYICSLLMI